MGRRRGNPTPMPTVPHNGCTVDLFCVITVKVNDYNDIHTQLSNIKDIAKATADKVLLNANTGVEIKAVTVNGGFKH